MYEATTALTPSLGPSHLAPPEKTVADGIVYPLDPRYVPLRRRVAWIGVVTRGLLVGGAMYGIINAAIVPVPYTGWVYAVGALMIVAMAVWSQWWPGVSYRYAAYRVDAQGLEIRRGVLWRSVTTLPRSRVQHTDVSQGPFERQFGLGTLSVHTAGTAHARVALRGLEYQRALRIREHLLPRDEHDVI
jgi:hypothetical protein